MSETVYNDETNENHDNVNDQSDATPSAYDTEQDNRAAAEAAARDEESAAKDREIADLKARLAAAEDESSTVIDVPSQTPVTTEDDVAKFHEVPAPGTDAPTTAGDTLGSIPIGETPTVSVTPAPPLSDSVNPDTSADAVRNQEDLKAAVSEILTLTREIHETVAWVKEQAPQVGTALANSPFGKMLPTFFPAGS